MRTPSADARQQVGLHAEQVAVAAAVRGGPSRRPPRAGCGPPARDGLILAAARAPSGMLIAVTPRAFEPPRLLDERRDVDAARRQQLDEDRARPPVASDASERGPRGERRHDDGDAPRRGHRPAGVAATGASGRASAAGHGAAPSHGLRERPDVVGRRPAAARRAAARPPRGTGAPTSRGSRACRGTSCGPSTSRGGPALGWTESGFVVTLRRRLERRRASTCGPTEQLTPMTSAPQASSRAPKSSGRVP